MTLRIGPLIVCAAVAVARAVWLAAQISGVTVTALGYLWLADLPVLGLLGLLLVCESRAPRGWRWLPLLAAIVVTTLYLVDVAAVVSLNARLQMSDLTRFGVEWWLLPSYVNRWSILGAGSVVAAFLVCVPLRGRAERAVGFAACLLVLTPLAVQQRAIPPHLHKYTTSILGMGREFAGLARQPMPRYTVGDYEAYRDDYGRLFDVPFTSSRRNIVLVVVESLSASDSFRTSGLGHLLDRFDALSARGTLFTNFFANFEASEGGIVSLLSGVPPLHFPTASTDTFAEYALQPAVTAEFARAGYRTTFLTSVPLRFISMDRYVTSPTVGFHVAAGQHEIARFSGAPRYAFQSPADHLLYEEVLHHAGTRETRRRQPVFVTAVTASSHPPYVDPRGQTNAAPQVWNYVQDELWWLYEQLLAQGFFEDGLLIITGDHRKMLPVTEHERARYGDSAKARVPLAIIGAGVPAGRVDDRVFQQADLLRMLDRVGHSDQALSPFAIWVERYVYVFGVASNASRLEIFQAGDQGRRGYQARLRGAEIAWLSAPAQAVAIEGAIHRQRVAQQAQRAASIRDEVMAFGRDLLPSDREAGVLVGRSQDLDPLRDPDDPRGALVVYPAMSFGDDPPEPSPAGAGAPSMVTIRGFLPIDAAGEYWFSVASPDTACLAIDRRMVLACTPGLHEGSALLVAGVHRFDLRFVQAAGAGPPALKWLPAGGARFAPFPQQLLWKPRR